MKCQCPKCGYEWEEKSANQVKGGEARWSGTTKAERSEAAKKAVLTRWAKKKAADAKKKTP